MKSMNDEPRCVKCGRIECTEESDRVQARAERAEAELATVRKSESEWHRDEELLRAELKARVDHAEALVAEYTRASEREKVRTTETESNVLPIMSKVIAEVRRAERLFPEWATDFPDGQFWNAAIVSEEAAEIQRALNDYMNALRNTVGVKDRITLAVDCMTKIRTECIQTAAMAIRLAANLNPYALENLAGFPHAGDGGV